MWRCAQALLAHLGLPLKDCKQPYNFMSKNSLQTLKTKLAQFNDRYDLKEVFYGSFYRVTTKAEQIFALPPLC